jgi:DnaJ-domain-containing protein 1
MPPFVIALVIVVGGLWIIKKMARSTPAQSKAFTQKLSGGGIMAFAGWLAMRGMMQLAIPVFLFGLGLAGKSTIFPNGFPGGFSWGGKPSAGLKSRVQTQLLSMELDHDSGTMSGTILSGSNCGKLLIELPDAALKEFHVLCQSAPDQSLALFEAWLDRAKPEWRKTWGGTANGKARAQTGAMSRDEALSVLGLKPGASADEIKAAHKRLMKEFHPDKGGSDYLAAKINAAKDVLLPD